MKLGTFVGCLVVAWLALEGGAEAQSIRQNKIDGVRPELHISLGPGFGTGFQLEIPIVPDGFLKHNKFEDELVISPGFEFFLLQFHGHHHGPDDDVHGGFNPAFGPTIAARWNVYVHDQWSVFPELGLTVMIAEDHFAYHGHHHGNDHYHAYVDPMIGGGARWHFSDRGSLVFRLVFPFGFQFGVAF